MQHELAAWIVTVHLIVALVIVSLLLYATVYAFFAWTAQVAVSVEPCPAARVALGDRWR